MVTKYDLVSFCFCFLGGKYCYDSYVDISNWVLSYKCKHIFHTCKPVQFTSIKYKKIIIFFIIWPYWKTDTGNCNFRKISLF